MSDRERPEDEEREDGESGAGSGLTEEFQRIERELDEEQPLEDLSERNDPPAAGSLGDTAAAFGAPRREPDPPAEEPAESWEPEPVAEEPDPPAEEPVESWEPPEPPAEEPAESWEPEPEPIPEEPAESWEPEPVAEEPDPPAHEPPPDEDPEPVDAPPPVEDPEHADAPPPAEPEPVEDPAPPEPEPAGESAELEPEPGPAEPTIRLPETQADADAEPILREAEDEPAPEEPAAPAPAEPAKPPAPAQPAASASSTPADPPRPRPLSTPQRSAASNRLAALAASIPEEELEERTPTLWLRFLAGSMLIVSSVAAAVAIAGLLFFNEIANDLKPIPKLQSELEPIAPDDPQTILIVGSDLRANDERGKDGGLSDTTMLLRIDPEKDVLSLFSLPRDLKVSIPGVGVDKLNAAYGAGGIKKTIQTVKAFMGININHAVEINFQGFADAVDAIGCVYIDVDRDYFNDNAGLPLEEQYAEIDINAGYQRLCGLKALQYVRYRKNDNDLVRAARQQDFLREARARIDQRELLGAALFGSGTGSELIDIFTENTNSDIDDEAQIIGLLKSFANMIDVPVNEVHFEGDIGGPDNPFVTATDREVERAKDEFLNGVGSEGQRGGEESNESKEKKRKRKKAKPKEPKADVLDTSEVLSQGRFATQAEQFEANARTNARRLGIPVYYPTRIVPGSGYSADSRDYDYKNEDDKKELGYKTVLAYTTPSTITEYYGVMGTTWDDPPILRNPSEEREIDGRDYLLFYDAGRLRLVGWKEKGNSYWLTNTLTQSIGEAEMIEMATTMEKIG